ncbi:MAG TPA: DUF29 domain-containing protein [Acetobacteraceae bacterium]|nr:DUF29 domain-containing protein [Acetobacteraceae bacterium]
MSWSGVSEAEAMSDYDTDLLVWSTQQAALLRRMGAGERVNDQVDWTNLAEEIESLGKSDRRELESRIRTVLVHLIKLLVSPAIEPRVGWQETIVRERAEIQSLVRQSPSLRPTVAQVIVEELPAARKQATIALRGHGAPPVPAEITLSEDQVLGAWLPD